MNYKYDKLYPPTSPVILGRHSIPFDDAVAVGRLWNSASNSHQVDIGALEPTLWRDGDYSIGDLVSALDNIFSTSGKSLTVTMTTNGSLLHMHAKALSRTNIKKIRVSWNNSDPTIFREISGMPYDGFILGLQKALELGLPISLNRLLLRGYLGDMPQVLDFIQKYGLTLKIFDLYWTPNIANQYSRYYIHWSEVIKRYVAPRTIDHESGDPSVTRYRMSFLLPNNARVVVKTASMLDRKNEPCKTCHFHQWCLEGYGEYIRVDPDLTAYPCYLRRDISFSLVPFIQGKEGSLENFRKGLLSAFFLSPSHDISNMKLRFIVTRYCNHKCLFPGTSTSWCLMDGAIKDLG